MSQVALCLLLVATVSARSDVAISTPDIYPDADDPFVGDVTVRVVNNAPHSFLTYTLDRSEPRNTSAVYTEPILLFKPGEYTVTARAFPDSAGRGASASASRTYTVVAADRDPPQLQPPPGTYRGRLTLKPTKHLGGNKFVMLYCVNPTTDNPKWIEYVDDHEIVFDTAGEYNVQLVVVEKSDPSRKATPMARYRYILLAPLVYDVSTECAKCAGPTIGETFTVWLQNVKSDALVFLTTTSHGCERRSHRLDDTEESAVGPFRPYAHFNTLDDDTVVFVCVSEDRQSFVSVSRRTGAASFKLLPPLRPVVRTTNPPGDSPDGSHQSSGTDMSSSFSLSLKDIIVGILATLGLIVVIREGSRRMRAAVGIDS